MREHATRAVGGVAAPLPLWPSCTALRGGPHHSASQHRLLWVHALLPPAGLLAGSCTRVARVLSFGAYQRRDTQPRAALPGVPYYHM